MVWYIINLTVEINNMNNKYVQINQDDIINNAYQYRYFFLKLIKNYL